MRIDDQDEFVDRVAQAVIDRLDERDRIEGMVSLVVNRVLALQQQKADALQENASLQKEPEAVPHV